MEIFEEKYQEDMSKDKVIELGLSALDAATEEGLNAPAVEIAMVSTKESFHKLDPKKVKSYVEKIIKKK